MFANIYVVEALFKYFVDNIFYNVPISTTQTTTNFVWNINVLECDSRIVIFMITIIRNFIIAEKRRVPLFLCFTSPFFLATMPYHKIVSVAWVRAILL